MLEIYTLLRTVRQIGDRTKMLEKQFIIFKIFQKKKINSCFTITYEWVTHAVMLLLHEKLLLVQDIIFARAKFVLLTILFSIVVVGNIHSSSSSAQKRNHDQIYFNSTGVSNNPDNYILKILLRPWKVCVIGVRTATKFVGKSTLQICITH